MKSVPRNAHRHHAGLLALGLAVQGFAAEPTVDEIDAAPPASEVTDTEAVTSPAGGGGSSVIERVAPPRRTKRLVYICRDGSIPMFSDRPCGDDGRARRLDLAVPMSAGSAPSTQVPAPSATTRPINAPAPPRAAPAEPDRCTRLEEAIAAIDARMRQGYSAREAAGLWERWRAAKAKLRDARC
jgi:hypothetical protein